MNQKEFIDLIHEIVRKSNELKNKYTNEINAPINYCCIFSKNDKHFEELIKLSNNIWKVLEQTKTWPLYIIQSIDTIAWELKLLKIRKYDDEHPELWDADFTIENYIEFKKEVITKKEFKIINKNKFEMIELKEDWADVRTYFSFPTLLDIYKI